tara:strand:- start:2456 stop:3130 length:675 start_codon:yes stop_codon:yes gene_type:complete
MDVLFTNKNIKMIAQSFIKQNKKEHINTILDPLQCILQLALLSFCPVGTKLSLENNILYIQEPSYSQGIIRWYNNDNKDDVFFLFNACKRFPVYYLFLKEISYKKTNLYDVLLKNAKKGVDKLSQTYSNISNPSILHTFEIFKALLEDPDIVPQTDDSGKREIENVFKNIKDVYDIPLLNAIYNILLLLNKYPNNYTEYIGAINKLIKPTNENITKWIKSNVLF